MRQIVNIADGGYEVLKIEEVPNPEPKEDELLIDVKAAGINFADILARKGMYADAPDKPCVVGYEASGVVEKTGREVDEAWKGKPVIAMTRFGGQSEKITVAESQVFEKPASLTFERAAALPVNYLTAWVLIKVMGSLQPEETILIQNVGGGVGLAALDIAKYVGAATIGTASSWKHEFLYNRGLGHAIDYRNKSWYEELMELTEGKGVELIIDALGGKEWKRGYKALRSTGRLGMYGISSASRDSRGGLKSKWNQLKVLFGMPIFHPVPMINKNRGVFGVNLGRMWQEVKKARRWFHRILEGLEQGWVRPHVDATFSFEKAADAHRYIEERRNIGKVILVP